MTVGDAEQSLQVLRDRMRTVLDGQADGVLEDLIQQCRASYEDLPRRKGVRKGFWGFQVSPERPLGFKSIHHKGMTIRVDLYCQLNWSAPSGQVGNQQNIVIRVWALDEDTYYREEWD